MNRRIIVRILGILLLLEALMMIPSLLISIYYKEEIWLIFGYIILGVALIGFLLSRVRSSTKLIKVREGFAIVALGWVLFSIFGALPFMLSGYIPSFVDAFFETVSGFTTTGATVLDNIESLPKGLLFWRSFTHWNGGMGILVFTVAVLPRFGVGGFQIFKAESTGPVVDKVSARINNTAKILYTTYIIFTLILIALLLLAGMDLYDASVYTFGTVGTGGFATKQLSLGAYSNPMIHIIIGIFMVLSGVNFSLYYSLYKGKWKSVIKDSELRLYLGFILISTLLITFNISNIGSSGFFVALKDAFFQVSSLITTTGYTTVNYDLWPTFSKWILFMLMFVGGSAGSTAGGIKNIRILILFKLIGREISRIFHPRAVIPVKVGKEVVPSSTVNSIVSFFVLYLLFFITGTLIVSLDGITLESAASAVVSTLGNIGPGFGSVGPAYNFSSLSDLSTITLSILMLLGRLELFTIVALLTPKAWTRDV